MSEDSKGGWGATKAARNAQMVEFRSEGKSYGWIASHFGVDRSRVFQILNPEKTRANDEKKRAMAKAKKGASNSAAIKSSSKAWCYQ